MNKRMSSIMTELKKIYLMYGDTTSLNVIKTMIIDENMDVTDKIQFQKDENLNIKIPVIWINSKKIIFFKPVKEALQEIPLPIIEDDSIKIKKLLNELNDIKQSDSAHVTKYKFHIDNINSIESIDMILAELERIYDYYNDKLDFPRIMGYIVNSPQLYITQVNVERTKLFNIPIYLPIGKFADNDSEGLLNPDKTLLVVKSENDIKQDSNYIANLINRLIYLMTESK